MRADDDQHLGHDITCINPAQPKVDQHTRRPQIGHHCIVEHVVSIDEPDAHVARVVMRAVQIVQPRESVARAVPPILHHVVEQQEQAQRGGQADVSQRPFPLRGQPTRTGRGAEEDRGLGYREQHRHADRLDDAVVAGLLGLAEQVRAPQFEQREAEIDCDYGQGRRRHGQILFRLLPAGVAARQAKECRMFYILARHCALQYRRCSMPRSSPNCAPSWRRGA